MPKPFPKPETLNRRQLLAAGAALAAQLGVPASSTAAAPKPPMTVRDRLWLWSHVADSYSGQFSLPGQSRITPVEAAFFLSIPNVFMIQLDGEPDPENLEQYYVPFRSLREVVWSVVDPQDVTPAAERQKVLQLAFAKDNITGVVMDDFFIRRKSWTEKQVADLSLEELATLKRSLKGPAKKLGLWAVVYTHELNPKISQHLKLCDTVQLWTWWGKDLRQLDANYNKLKELMAENQSIELGLYWWDFGDGKPLSIELMEHQCETGLQWLREGAIKGMVFCGSWLCDRGLETVEWTREWIRKVGDERIHG